jgi:hypothetical protein
MTQEKQLPRGIRNCNPGNIRDSSTKYIGEVEKEHDTDSAFKQFKNIAYGYRAMFVVLSTYYKKYGLKTIFSWIHRWAPASENNTDAYVKEVCRRTGIAPDAEIDIANEDMLVKIVSAMSFVENGIEAKYVEVKVGYKLFIEL